MLEQTLMSISQKQDEILAMLKDLRNNGVVNNKDRVYDLTDLENMLHVSKRTLHKWKSKGKMRFTQVGKNRFFLTSKLNIETTKGQSPKIKSEGIYINHFGIIEA